MSERFGALATASSCRPACEPWAYDHYVAPSIRVEETGLGAGVLNDPAEGVVWPARRMASYGQQIEPGHIILSGSFIRPIECPPESHIQANYGTFGSVEISFG
jgi:2-keto-4-pentenoate hydratase